MDAAPTKAATAHPPDKPEVPDRRDGFFTQIRRYPVVAVTVLVGVGGVLLHLSGAEALARVFVSGYALIIASTEAWRMLRKLRHGTFGLDILALAAILSTVMVGEYWASLVICLMLAGGEALEEYAGHRARHELEALLARAPRIAHRVDTTGAVIELAADEVAVADRVLVLPHEVVPVDGTLDSPAADVDESQLTGESLPVSHTAGDTILSGTLNTDEAFKLTATAIAAHSQYQRVVDLVSEAANSRAPLVRLADRVAIPFTLTAFTIAGLAWYLSGDPVRFAEVLVVATPCPLLIAAPVAYIAGISRAAKAGIIVRTGGTLEQLSRVRTVAFDKTGTLTTGRPEVVAVRPRGGFSANGLLTLVASAEQYSGHILAAALVAAAADRGVNLRPASESREVTAQGVLAIIDGRSVAVGKRSFISSVSGPVSSAAPHSGQMAVYAAVDGVFAGDILLADAVRPEAADTLAALARMGVTRTVMVTGDLAATAHHVGDQLGIASILAECLPEDKVTAIRAESARPLMMVGDGVNDAPVLAAADIGVAMGARGSTAASESADVVILLDDISRVARAVSIGWRTTRIALDAIWLGVGLSLALMVVATFGVLPAIVGATLQEAVDVLTILLALRALVDRPDPRLDREARGR
ncbi:MAG TPA: heavy metal translocating P-type ATPase [Glaciihabitans sp.]|nr:heavy metal translocating P-type ATPase [Glaciihabitans sp.]